MLRLHGYPVSNYFNIARAALIEKGVAFEVVITRAAQDEAFLAMNPMGKIPVLETGEGWIGETVAIVEYLDDAFPDRPLRPAAALDRARSRQIVNITQMYIEAPVRSLFPGVFANGTNSEATIASARMTLDRATTALRRLMAPAPFLGGTRPGAADLFAFYNLDIAERIVRFVYGCSIHAEIEALDPWRAAMAARPSTQAVFADFHPHFHRYLADRGAPYRDDAVGVSGQLSHA